MRTLLFLLLGNWCVDRREPAAAAWHRLDGAALVRVSRHKEQRRVRVRVRVVVIFGEEEGGGRGKEKGSGSRCGGRTDVSFDIVHFWRS